MDVCEAHFAVVWLLPRGLRGYVMVIIPGLWLKPLILGGHWRYSAWFCQVGPHPLPQKESHVLLFLKHLDFH